eukprot:5942778-Amphidinium_carterae.1
MPEDRATAGIQSSSITPCTLTTSEGLMAISLTTETSCLVLIHATLLSYAICGGRWAARRCIGVCTLCCPSLQQFL